MRPMRGYIRWVDRVNRLLGGFAMYLIFASSLNESFAAACPPRGPLVNQIDGPGRACDGIGKP